MAAPLSIFRRCLLLLGSSTKYKNVCTSVRRACRRAYTDLATSTSYTQRSHLCGELGRDHIGQTVNVCGWLQYHRLSGTFIILRDWCGSIQIVVPETKVDRYRDLPLESVLEVKGTVRLRPPGQENQTMTTGEVEIDVDEITVLNSCSTNLPFEVRNFNKVKESLRLKHRYLELRLPTLQHSLRVRSKFAMDVRHFLANCNGFVEVETPTLFRRTPGFKQLLMVGGLDRYFQIARCYRDEGSKPDRQPEFTQIDLEMSYVTQDDVMLIVEKMLEEAWPIDKGCVHGPFPRMSYHQAMSSYGTDKPDLRFDWQIKDVSEVFRGGSCPPVFQPFMHTTGDSVHALVIPEGAKRLSNKERESIIEKAQSSIKAPVKVVACKLNEDMTWGSNLARHLDDATQQGLSQSLELAPSDLVLFAAGSQFSPNSVLGQARLLAVEILESKGVKVRRDEFSFTWVDDFPLFLPKEDGGEGLESAHHPFTAPHPDDINLVFSAPEQVRSQHYDLVLNGQEIGGGSIRIHDSALQRFILTDVLKEDVSQLEHLLHALTCGCPPHGGIALGLDRLLAIMLGAESIRDVIAFPKTSEGKDPLSRAPAPVAQEDLDYYYISLNKEDS